MPPAECPGAPPARHPGAPPARHPGAPPARRLALLLGTSQLLAWGLTYYVPAVATGVVAAEFGVSPAAVLGGFSVALLVTGLASPVACRWIDRVGGRPVLIAGVLAQAAGLLVMAGAGGLVQWYAGWVLSGLGMAGGLYDAVFAAAGRALGAAARPALTGIAMIGGFASTVGWPLGTALLPLLGWRGMVVAYAAMLLAINLPLFLLLPRDLAPRDAPATATGPAPQGGRLLFVAIAAFFTLRAAFSTTLSIGALVLLIELGLGTGTAVVLVALIGPAQVGMRVLQAVVGRSWSPVATTWVGALIVPVTTLLPILAFGSGWMLPAATAFVLGYGLSNGFLTIARGTLPLVLFGPEGYATRIGQMAMPVMLAQAAAPLLSAPLLAAGSPRVVLVALMGLSLAAASCLVPLLPAGPWRR